MAKGRRRGNFHLGQSAKRKNQQSGERNKRRNSRPRVDSRAPYNFVPLPKAPIIVNNLSEFCIQDGPFKDRRVWQCHDVYPENLLSGEIDITLTTETPLFIGLGLKEKGSAGEDAYPEPQDFYHHGNPAHPAIPGSSIRGMLRTLVEIVSFGKFSTFDSNPLVYRAVGDSGSSSTLYRKALLGEPKNTSDGVRWRYDYPRKEMNGGFLKKIGTDWYIIPSKKHHSTSIIHILARCVDAVREHNPKKEYDETKDIITIFVDPPEIESHLHRRGALKLDMALVKNRQKISHKPREGFQKVFLIKSGWMKNKRYHCAIYDRDPNASSIKIPRKLWKTYENDTDMSRGFKTRKLKDRSPLFYLTNPDLKSEENVHGLQFFGPTMMFRIPYCQSIGDHVKEILREDEGIDLAESIFGRVSPNGSDSIKGRVFLQDAIYLPVDGSPFYPEKAGVRVPKILSSPKPTSYQHYLEQPPEARTDPKKLKTWDSNGMSIRGYKLYWHQTRPEEEIFEMNGDVPKEPEDFSEDKLHIAIKPVRRGIKFKGRMNFFNLTGIELGALLFVLNLPNGKKHKIGLGKSLGMGSISLQSEVKLVDYNTRYGALFNLDGQVNDGIYRLEDSEIGEYKEQFERFILMQLNESGLENLWENERMKELAALLEWENRPPYQRVSYLPSPVDSEGKIWRDRPVLPKATDVIRQSGIGTGS